MSGPSGDRLKTRRTDDGGSSPRRGVGFQPAGRVIRRGWLGWAWLCSLARRTPTNLEVRRHGLDRRLLMDDGLRFIKPKKLRPPRSGDSDEWAERRQVENPSYGRRRFVAPSWRRLSACGASHLARLAGLGVVVLHGAGYDKPGGSSPRDRSNAIDGLGKARTIKPKDCRPPGNGESDVRGE
jgi:hypothetical protein